MGIEQTEHPDHLKEGNENRRARQHLRHYHYHQKKGSPFELKPGKGIGRANTKGQRYQGRAQRYDDAIEKVFEERPCIPQLYIRLKRNGLGPENRGELATSARGRMDVVSTQTKGSTKANTKIVPRPYPKLALTRACVSSHYWPSVQQIASV